MGAVIANKYEIVGKLGQGGMGTVYKVRHTTLDTIYALKMLPEHLAANPDLVARFTREARVMAQLKHENIVRVLDVVIARDENLYYLLEEFIDGRSVSELLKERGAFPVSQALDIARQVASALAFAHERGVIHRDIKPSNVLVEQKLRLRALLTDFGIAKVEDAGERTRTDMLLGSLRYAAPEQMGYRGSGRERIPVDQRADIYAFGLFVFEMCDGQPFFAGLEQSEILGRVMYDTEPLVPRFSRPVPLAVAALVERAISRDPAGRQQSMAEVLREIDACRAGLPVAVGSPAAAGTSSDAPTLAVGPDSPTVAITPGERARDDEASDEELDERIRALEMERQRRLVTAAEEKARAAERRALEADAPAQASARLREGRAHVEEATVAVREGRHLRARELFDRAALDFEEAAAEASAAHTGSQRTAAERARQADAQARRAAEEAAAAELAAAQFDDACAQETRAELAFAHSEYTAAEHLFESATRAFEEAAREAARRRAGGEAGAAAGEDVLARRQRLRARLARAEEDARRAAAAVVEADALRWARDSYEKALDAREEAERAAAAHEYEAAARAFELAAGLLGQAAAEVERAHARQGPAPRPAGGPAAEATEATILGPMRDSPDGERASATRVEYQPPWPEPEAVPEPEGDAEPEPEGEAEPWAEPPPRRWVSRTIGMLTAILVAVIGWYVVRHRAELLEMVTGAPPVMLAWEAVRPDAAEQTIRAGDRLGFAARVREPAPRGEVRYVWTVDGEERARGPTWEYAPGAGDAGRTREVRVVASTPGQTIERRWRVRVDAVNRPPAIENASPAGIEVVLGRGGAQEFSVQATDPDARPGDLLTYVWQRNGKVVAEGTRASWTLADAGSEDREVRVEVKDRDGASSGERTWRVAVGPTAEGPRIVGRTPPGEVVTVAEGKSADFGVRAEGGPDARLNYAWFLDGEEVSREVSWRFTAPVPSGAQETHKVEAEVADRDGRKAPRAVWTVAVRATPPRIVDYQPRASVLSVDRGEPAVLSVTARGSDPSARLREEWRLDGRVVAADEPGRLVLPTTLTAGAHQVEFAAIDPRGLRSAPQRWTVEVGGRAPEPARPASPAPPPAKVESTALSEAETRAWLRSFRDALERKDIARLRALGFITRDDQARKMKEALDRYREYRVSITNEQIRLEGDRATVSFDRTDSDETGRALSVPRQTVRLVKGPNGVVMTRTE
jgi:tRNA A-37 threonylcarbamoyl transferase component Bud32